MPDDQEILGRALNDALQDGGSARRLFLRDMIVEANIGVYDSEKKGPQRVRIDVDLHLAPPEQAIDDAIENVLDYGFIWDGIEAILADGHIQLQETLAERIMGLCLSPSEVIGARVSTAKLDVYPAGAAVGYEITRIKTTFNRY